MGVRFALDVKVKVGREDELEEGYAGLRERLEGGVPGLITHQLCRGQDDPSRFLITSEWEDAESNREWEASDDHRRLTHSFRELFEEARLTRYEVRAEVRT
jgi:heme-degrading monooxygenase HmoA